MAGFSRVTGLELVGPTGIGLRLTDDAGECVTGQIVVSPVNFITDFAVFLTAVWAGGETRPVDAASLRRSWEHARQTLREWLVEKDPLGRARLAACG